MRCQLRAKNELSRITIDLRKEDHKRLKALAALEGKSMRELILESIEERISGGALLTNSDDQLKHVLEEVLKKYAPALKKLANS
jgi:type I restriction-modification system DNA methylase subunit